MNWKWICLATVSIVSCLLQYGSLQAWQTPPRPDATTEEILDFYQEAHGGKAILDQLQSFRIEWDVSNAASTETSRYQSNSNIEPPVFCRCTIIWTPKQWRTRMFLEMTKNEGVGLFEDGSNMFSTDATCSSILGKSARRGNRILRFFDRGVPFGDWSLVARELKAEGPTVYNGIPVWKLAMQEADRGIFVLFIEQETGLAAGMEYKDLTGDSIYSRNFLEHRDVNGIVVPHRIEIESDPSPTIVWKLVDFEFNEPIPDSEFKIPPLDEATRRTLARIRNRR